MRGTLYIAGDPPSGGVEGIQRLEGGRLRLAFQEGLVVALHVRLLRGTHELVGEEDVEQEAEHGDRAQEGEPAHLVVRLPARVHRDDDRHEVEEQKDEDEDGRVLAFEDPGGKEVGESDQERKLDEDRKAGNRLRPESCPEKLHPAFLSSLGARSLEPGQTGLM